MGWLVTINCPSEETAQWRVGRPVGPQSHNREGMGKTPAAKALHPQTRSPPSGHTTLPSPGRRGKVRLAAYQPPPACSWTSPGLGRPWTPVATSPMDAPEPLPHSGRSQLQEGGGTLLGFRLHTF
ncbi:uncharacterized protein LOC119521744 isoform X5 [Choloepus didactylus]|uniref:uncharacterized protein LOC119521744 isoform X5 n=1 Tax=Choloepus didactylus TaxID=27675 RepID=UPI0018A0C694|nr:uncharacterized protein LOC119521744 isoform X5 [Choloepus didactylus]